jgi:hypothetical protein
MNNSTTLLAIPSTFQELSSKMDAIPKELQLPFVVAVSRYLSWYTLLFVPRDFDVFGSLTEIMPFALSSPF